MKIRRLHMNIKDIAALANVGVSTVSRVINNHPDVHEETRKKVLEIIKENNYVPNNSARILKQSSTTNIGILVKGVFNPFFSEILKSVTVGIQKAGYTMIFQYHQDKEDTHYKSDIGTLLGFIKEKRLQGIICLGGNFVDLTDEDLEKVDIPIVLLSVGTVTWQHLKRCSSISINNEVAAYKATEHLIRNGHQNIGLILGEKLDFGVSKARYEGYKKALKDYNIREKDDYIAYGEYEYEAAYKIGKKMLENHSELTAFFAISDIMAVGVAKASVDLGRKIGEDLSIIGFDGMEIAKYYHPSITTMKQPKDKMGQLSVELLLELLHKKIENKHICLEVELVEGQSCHTI